MSEPTTTVADTLADEAAAYYNHVLDQTGNTSLATDLARDWHSAQLARRYPLELGSETIAKLAAIIRSHQGLT